MIIAEVIKTKDVPPVLRGSLSAWIKVILSPVQSLITLYDAYVLNKRNELKYNGQVMYLERCLNDKFDPINRGIYIDDAVASGIVPVFIYNVAENQETVVIYEANETEATTIIYENNELYGEDFVVFVPVSVSNLIGHRRIKAVVDFYKITSKSFKIQTI